MGNTTEYLKEGRAIDLFVAYRFLRIVMGLGDVLPKGSYKLNAEVVPDKEGDMKSVGKKGDLVVVFSDTVPTDEVMGQSIFKVIHQKSKEEIYVSLDDLEET
jgi:hypothetical protein